MANDRFTAKPSLIIGLGGTGIKVATFVKKSMLELNQNQMPLGMALLVLDTETKVRFAVSGWGKERSEQHATGPVMIEGAGEYLALSKNVKSTGLSIKAEQAEAAANPRRLRSQPRRHISTWFQATHYIDEAVVDVAVWNLNVGAGRFRQFGRLALFTHINEIQNLLLANMRAIRSLGRNELYVHVAGSLAGGTGAALFADVPHLIKQLAPIAGFTATPVVLGHFVLPEGFTGTPAVQLRSPGVRQDFDARCFAALRELTRLQGQSIPQTGGYPISYAGGVEALNAKLTESPYSAVYLYDGVRERNPVNAHEIENGLAPAIADAIVSYIDDLSGAAFCAHSVNYKAFYSAFEIQQGQPTFGSVSTFTIELPIYHITEGWAHTLAREALDRLLEPSERDAASEVPFKLDAGLPGGQPQNAVSDAEDWLRSSTTSLVRQLGDWGKQAEQGQVVRSQVTGGILQRNAQTWQEELAPHDAAWEERVANARMELEGSLKEQKSVKYFVSHAQPGSSPQQKAAAMINEVEAKLRLMVGEPRDVWMRSGGDFRARLVGLAMHHARAFDDALIKRIRLDLNGDPNTGTPTIRKQGKLGYVQAFLMRLDAILKKSAEVLALVENETKTKRKAQYEDLDRARRVAADEMRNNGGFRGANLKKFRDRSDAIAQFHKTDIARQVVCSEVLEKLQIIVEQALAEIRLWEQILATANLNEGGAYALVAAGQREVAADRVRSKNSVHWMIDDDEPGDQYIQSKYNQYSDGALDEILSAAKWDVGLLDGSKGLRIDFKVSDHTWDREVGNTNQEKNGRRNVDTLLIACRSVFEKAWDDMSVVAYLHSNFKNKYEDLAERIFDKSGYLLSTTDDKTEPPMRTTFMRVCKQDLSQDELAFLTQLRWSVARRFRETTTAMARAQAQVEDYLRDSGEPSRDRNKLTFVMFGDLLKPSQIAGFQNARPAYVAVSGKGSGWKSLHVLPAETHALAIEKDVMSGPSDTQQRRRELDDMVVAVLEDLERFQTAMHCLAYGETDYDWSELGESGVLLHRFYPKESAGQSYWRLVLLPKGTRSHDGKLYTTTGQLARPEAYQLTDVASNPDLLRAFIQLVCIGKDLNTGVDINWDNVEASLEWAMAEHKQLWLTQRDLSWTPTSRVAGNPQRLGEAHGQATEIIRLNALINIADRSLGVYDWAWRPRANPDPTLGPEQRTHIQRQMDLWTAIRGTAKQELQNLSEGLLELGNWTAGIPTDAVSLSTNRPNDWLCPNGHRNPADALFCDECGYMRREQVCENGHEMPTNANFCAKCGAPRKSTGAGIAIQHCENGHEMLPGAKFCHVCGQPAKPVEVAETLAAAQTPAGIYRLTLNTTPDKVTVGQKVSLHVRLLPATASDSDVFQLPPSVIEAYCMLSADGIRIPDTEVVGLPVNPDQATSTDLEMQAHLLGERPYYVDIYSEDPTSGQVSIHRAGGRISVTAPKASQRQLPILPTLDVRVAPEPDLVLQVDTQLSEDSVKAYRLEYQLTGLLPSAKTRKTFAGNALLSSVELARMRPLLNQTLRQTEILQPEDARQRMALLGTYLFDQLFPADRCSALRDFFLQVADRIKTCLIREDGHTWIPWELVVPYRKGQDEPLLFLGERFQVGRWVEGLGPRMYSEVPVGEIALAHYKTLDIGGETQDEEFRAWEEILGALGTRGILQVAKPETPYFGLHLLRHADQIVARRDIVARNSDATVTTPEQEAIHARLDLRLKRPVVTLGVLAADLSWIGADDDWLLPDRILPFLRAGASAVIGPWWPTSSAADEIFWETFYGLLGRCLPLGEAVWRARQTVKSVLPYRLDWLAYTLFGDPRAKPYWPQPSEGYAAVECLNPDQPLQPGKTYTFRASVRSRPSIWHADRLVQTVSLPEQLQALFLAPGLQTDFPQPVEMEPLGRTMRQATVDLTPITPGDYPLLVQLLDRQEHLKTLQLTLKVRASVKGKQTHG